MNTEQNRLRTFAEWPTNAAVSAERIAKAGFYYTGPEQTVQCFACGVRISEWNFEDQAMISHRLANPDCPFVLDPDSCNNVPLIRSSSLDVTPSSSSSNSSQNSEVTNFANVDLTQYCHRLATFENWPIPEIVSSERVARSGFYYLQDASMVECIYCRGVIFKWEPGDDPEEEHKKHFPRCDFYLRELHPSDLSAEKLGDIKLLPGTASNYTDLGIQHHLPSRQPKHATYEGRLRTFEGWPSNLRQTPEMLADAGFYYVGQDDQVRCFHCDGGLRHWEENDEAWVEHAKWFPKCGYVALVKGQDFIKQCVENRPPLEATVLSSVLDENHDNSITPPASPANSTSQSLALQVISPQNQHPLIRRRVTDAELERLLGTEPAMVALGIGIHVGRVKMALKRRMEQSGVPYANADQLIEDATRVQLAEEDNVLNRTPDSPSSELVQLLNQIITSAEASSSNGQTEILLNNENNQSMVPRRRRRPSAVAEVDSENGVSAEDKDNKNEKNAASLEEENRRLREARLCKICLDKEVGVVFLPCGHLSTCFFCAPSLTHCPMCRQDIRAWVRTFLA